MSEKPVTALLYLFIGLFLALYPIVSTAGWVCLPETIKSRINQHLLKVRELFDRFPGLIIAIAIMVGSRLAWWRTTPEMLVDPWFLATAFLAIGCWFVVSMMDSAPWCGQAIGDVSAFVLGTAITIGVLLFKEPLLFNIFTTWHHWSAFVGPAELLREGWRPFVDFPIQYGFGPSALIVLLGGIDSWQGLIRASVTTTFLYAITLMGFSRILLGSWATPVGALVFASLLASMLLWTSYPPTVVTPLLAPSTTGLRFLPVGLLFISLAASEVKPWLAKYWQLIGHAMLILCGLVWSPEAAFMCAFIWCPYFVLRRQQALSSIGRFESIKMAVRSICVLAMIITFSIVVLMAIFRIVYAQHLPLIGYLAPLLYPPGAMPIDFSGPVIYVATALGLGLSATIAELKCNSAKGRLGLLTIFACFGALSYCMGRSHSNNFVNILPIAILPLIAALVFHRQKRMKQLAALMIAAPIVLLPMFGWSNWYNRPPDGTAPFETADTFISRLNHSNPLAQAELRKLCDTAAALSCDVDAILEALPKIGNEPVIVADRTYLVFPAWSPWSNLYQIGNHEFHPVSLRYVFAANGVKRNPRSGWLLIHRDFREKWLPVFEAAYQRDRAFVAGPYEAIRFTPRPAMGQF